MKTVIIIPKTRSQDESLSDFLKKTKIDALYLNEQEKEDIGLKILMKEANRKKTVSRAAILNKLKTT